MKLFSQNTAFKLFTFFFLFVFTQISAQTLVDLIPNNTATHVAVNDGSWFTASTWNSGTVPGEGAIVVIPMDKSVTYEGNVTDHIFALKVMGEFTMEQTDANATTLLVVDTFIGLHMSFIKIYGDDPNDGKIDVEFKAFDIEGYKAGSNIWNATATAFYSDNAPTYEVPKTPGGDVRYNTFAEAEAGDTEVVDGTPSLLPDGIGVLGRHQWDPMQFSLGLVSMGQLEIIGQEKTNMVKLGADAPRSQKNLQLSETPIGWEAGDQIVVTAGGNLNAASNGTDQKQIDVINGTAITTTNNLNKNHEGRPQDDLHCYVGNLTRNITFSSFNPSVIDERAHLMAMHNDTNIQIKNAAFVDMGRTDKDRWLNDVQFDKWVETDIFKSKYSSLGVEVLDKISNPVDEITNRRGRYSIHLHKTGAAAGATPALVTGNVVWGNPGWGITHHDSHAFVNENIVYDVVGAGLVSETGSETGTWNNNLIVDIEKGHTNSPYTSNTYFDDYLFSGQGLGMKGRAVVCDGNVIASANEAIGVFNMNPSVSNTDRVDTSVLANRPGHEVDNFPLSINGYSVEGDGVVPLEAALIFKNTTIIDAAIGLKSIERDQAVNHESRSIFDNFKIWGARRGLSITYQADYSFNDLFISGKDDTSLGMYIWKHSHNHVFNRIKLVDLGHGIEVSKLVQSGNGLLKTRNNGVAPWTYIDLDYSENVGQLYLLELDDNTLNLPYPEHTDNTVILSSSDITPRPISYTVPRGLEGISVLDKDTDDEVDYAAEDFAFTVDALIGDSAGSYKFGVQQALAQGTLRLDYPQRMYEFASKAKFDEYISVNGVYKNPDDETEIYFIINESVPDRYTYEVQSFPNRIKILNPSSQIESMAQFESPEALAPTLQMVSRFGTVTQSTTQSGVSYEGEPIDVGAQKAIDGSYNGHINAQFYQRGELPVGSFSQTENALESWWDLELEQPTLIEYIDVWNTVELNGEDIEPNSPHFTDFWVLVSETSFDGMTLAQAQASAAFSVLNGTVQRKFSANNINTKGQFIRIQKVGTGKIQLAEVEVYGIPEVERCLEEVVFENGTWTPNAPTENSRAILRSDYDTSAENASIDACEVIIEEGITLTITADYYLHVENDITVEGTLDVLHQGSVVQVYPVAQVIKGEQGQINVALTTPNLKPRDFIVLGSPMVQDIPKGVDNPIFQKIKHLTSQFQPHPEVELLFPFGANFMDQGFDDWEHHSDNFVSGEGYYVRPQLNFTDGNKTYDLIYNEGTLSNGDVRYNIIYNEISASATDAERKNASPNILSNPYASPIDAAQFILENDAVDEIYLWEHNTAVGDYPGDNNVNFNMADISVFNDIGFMPASTGAVPLTNGLLSSMQGFGIKNNGSEDFVTFSNTMRRKTGNTTFRGVEEEKTSILLKINNNEYNLGSNTLIGFTENATPNFDSRYDSNRLGVPVSIYSHLIDGSNALAIQGRETFSEDITVLLGFSSFVEDAETEYEISIDALNGSALENATVYLRDNMLDKITNLLNESYTFINEPGTFNQRFTLLFKKPSVLNSQENELATIQLFPNPTSNILTINSPLTTIQKVSLNDVRGSLVATYNDINSGMFTLSMETLNTGMYFVNINTDSGDIVYKVLKN